MRTNFRSGGGGGATSGGVTLGQLNPAAGLSDTHMLAISEDGGTEMVRCTLAQLKAFLGTSGSGGGTTTPPAGDTTAPTITGASVANGAAATIILAASEALNTTPPAASAFTCTGGHTVTAVAINGLQIALTVDPAFVGGESAQSVAYVAPASNPIRDTAGNAMANFTGRTVTNNVGVADTAPPTQLQASVANAIPTVVSVTFGEALAPGFVPAPSAFSMTGHAISSVAISGSNVNLTVDPAFVNGEVARAVSYVQPATNGLRDAAGNLTASFSDLAIANNVAAPASLMADTYVLKTDGTKSASIDTTSIAMTADSGDYRANVQVRVNIRTADGLGAPAAADVKFAWVKVGADISQLTFAMASIPVGLNGNTVARGNGIKAPVKLGGWADGATSDGFYGTYQCTSSNLYAWGDAPPDTYNLLVLFSDGSKKFAPKQDNSGVPLTWSLT